MPTMHLAQFLVHGPTYHSLAMWRHPKTAAAGYDWTRQFTDFSFQGGTPSMFCIRDVTDGMPWIYPPAQTYFYVACVAACIYLTYQIIRTWPQARGRPN